MDQSPRFAEQLQQFWNRYHSALTSAARTCETIKSEAQKVLGSAHIGFGRFDAYDASRSLDQTAESLVTNLLSHAERAFAAPGASLSIERYLWRDAIDRHGRTANMDLPALWAELAQRYGGDAGRKASYRQTAQTLVDAFALMRHREIRRRRNGIELSTTIYTEYGYGPAKGQRTLTYHSIQQLKEVCQALKAVLVDAEAEAADIHAWDTLSTSMYDLFRSPFTSRTKHKAAGIELTFFFEKVTFLVEEPLATHLQLFIAEHGQLTDQAA
jgi:hypothetical protein